MPDLIQQITNCAALPGIDGIFKIDFRQMNDFCGVYFLTDGDEVVYVGQSVNILSRLHNHYNDSLKFIPPYKKKFDGAYFIKIPLALLDELEVKYIDLFNPKYNSRKYLSSRFKNHTSQQNEETLMRKVE